MADHAPKSIVAAGGPSVAADAPYGTTPEGSALVVQRRQMPVLTILLVVLNIAVFAYWWMLPPAPQLVAAPAPLATPQEVVVQRWAVIPLEITEQDLEPRTPVSPLLTLGTSLFLHGSWLHVSSNIFYLWVFGAGVERVLGRWRYLATYLICGVGAALVHVALVPTSLIPLLGASGAIAGLMAAYLVFFPKLTPQLIVFGFWFALQLIGSRGALSPTQRWTGGVALWVHVAGFGIGALLALVWRRRSRSTPVPAVHGEKKE